MLIDNESLIGEITPTVYIDKITLESTSQNEGLIVTLNLIVKDKVDSKLNSVWFGNVDLSKFINIKVIQTTESNIHSYLSKRRSLLLYEQDISLFMESLGYESFEPSDYVEAVNYYNDNTVIKDISLATPEGGVDGFVNQHRTTDNNGNTITDFNYRFKFETNSQSNLSHLSYFAFSYIDFEEFQKEFDITLPDQSLLRKMNGKITSDIVFETRDPAIGSELVSLATAFYDDNNVIWPGPIHQRSAGERWRTGTKETSKSKYLTERRVRNTKIQDFRIFAKFREIQYDLSIKEYQDRMSKLDFSPIKYDKSPNILTNDNMDITKKQSYFSNAWVSRSEINDINFIFGTNMHNIIKYKTKFGNLIENSEPTIRKRIFDLTKIKSLRIDRRRVKDINGFGTLGSMEIPKDRFDDDRESDKMITITGEQVAGNLLAQDDIDTGYIREVEVTTPYNESYSGGCRYFSVSDRQLKDITCGLYQYGASMIIEDGTVLFLNEILQNLKKNRKSLKQYLNNAALSYNPLAQKFSSKYINILNYTFSALAPDKAKKAPWIKPVVEYLYALQALTNSLNEKKMEEYTSLILATINPNTGSPEGLSAFIAVYDKMVTAVQNLLGKTSSLRSGQGLLDYSGQVEKKSYIGGTAKYPAFIECQNWFTNATVDAEGLKEVGSSCFVPHFPDINSPPPLEKRSFRVISPEEFNERVSLENIKYFGSNDPNLDISVLTSNISIPDVLKNTDFSYLSPRFVNRRLTKKEREEGKIASGGAFGIQRDFLTANRNDAVYREAESAMLSDNLGDLIANNGIAIFNADDFTGLIPVIYQGPDHCEEIPTINRNVDSEIDFVNPPAPPQSESHLFAINALNLAFAKSAVNNFAPKTNTVFPILSSENNPEDVTTAYLNLPNQVKFLFKASIAAVDGDTSSVAVHDFINNLKKTSVYEINWSLLQKVEVMTGFEINEQGYKVVKGEIWKTLTRELYNSVVGSGPGEANVVLCRLTPLSNNQYNIKYNKNIELPIYDKHFLLQIPPGEKVINRSYKILLSEKVVSMYKDSIYVHGGYITTNPRNML